MTRGRVVAPDVLRPLRWVSDLLSESFAIAVRTLRLDTWRCEPIRRQLVRQVHFCGVRSLPVVMVAAVVGGFAATQVIGFLTASGSGAIAPSLAFRFVMLVGPVAVALILMIRAGAVMVVELATVRATGQDRMLRSHGIDPFVYFVFPRAVGMSLGGLCLTACFYAVAAAATSIVLAVDPSIGALPSEVRRAGFEGITLSDAAMVLTNAAVPAGVIGLIASRIGLSIDSAFAEVPRVLPMYATQAIVALALIAGLGQVVF